MKVLMVTDSFYPRVGGLEKAVYEVSKRLVKLGCNMRVLTLNKDKAKDLEFVENMKILRIKSISLTRVVGVPLTVSLQAPFRMLNICQRENPDIIHVNCRFFFTTVCAVALKRLLKKPLIITVHKSSAFGKAWLNLAVNAYEKTVSKWILRKGDRIITVSNEVKRKAVRLGAESEKITVIPNGVDLNKFKPEKEHFKNSKRKSVKRVVFVGRLIFGKGVQNLIDSAPKILSKCQNVEFVIVGDGPIKETLRTQAKRRRVLNRFKFLGGISNVEEVLRKCDIFVLPSLSEGMPLTLLEAMATGLPVVATKVGGVSEILVNNVTGILIEPGNIPELADSIIQLLSDHKLSRRLGNKARLIVENKYSWEKTAELTLQVYRECLSSRGSSARMFKVRD